MFGEAVPRLLSFRVCRPTATRHARELSQQEGRDLAATSQAVFTSLVVQERLWV